MGEIYYLRSGAGEGGSGADAEVEGVTKKEQPETLTPDDTKKLARLVRKYGRRMIAEAAQKVRTKGPGRPYFPFERAHFAEWFEEVEAEYREAGSKQPFIEAAFLLYEWEIDEAERREPGRFERFLATVKNKRKRGKKDLALLRELHQRREDWLQHRQGGRK